MWPEVSPLPAGAGRSYLFAPGDRPSIIAKATSAGADVVVIDLEDAVSAEHKDEARKHAAGFLAGVAGTTPLHVRVSGCDTAVSDLDAVAGPALAGVRLPKVEDAQPVAEVAAWLEENEASGRIPPGVGIYPTIESAAGVERASAVLRSTPRIMRPVLGSADLLADLGIWDGDGLELLGHVQAELALRSRAARAGAPIDGAYPRLDDEAGLLAAARQARSFGFAGKSAIHPRQLAAIHEVFGATPEQYARALRVVAAFEAALAKGSATVIFEGQMLDSPVVARARSLLATRPPEGQS